MCEPEAGKRALLSGRESGGNGSQGEVCVKVNEDAGTRDETQHKAGSWDIQDGARDWSTEASKTS